MAEKTIETRAIISASDQTGGAFASVLQKLAKLEAVARATNLHVGAVGQSAKVSRQGELAVQREMRKVEGETAVARRQEIAHLRQVQRMYDDISGRQMALGIAGAAIAERTAHFLHSSLETYRHFDRERRYGKAVMRITDEEQAPLVDQAMRMGGTTKFTPTEVLEAQRDLAARGLNKDQILGVIPAAANLGQAMDVSLPDAVKQLEGAIFGLKKPMETTGDAIKSANQTADKQVKAAKISGMTPEDIRQLYKYGATGARMSGVSEDTLLAFGGISKKANMGGDEAGVAFRALMAAAQSPTDVAKTALLANHLDYSKYQKPIDHLDVVPFAKSVAGHYGVKLNAAALTAIGKVFSDPKLINDQAAFTPAVVQALGPLLGKKDAKSLKSIAGLANRFRNATGGGADVNGFLKDLMLALPGNLKLANAIFGPKQGTRIANALGDPETLKKFKELIEGHSDGYAKKVADERQSGFDGAVSRFETAVDTLKTSVAKAFDAEGKGGLLTGITDEAGKFVTALSQAPPQLQRLGTEAGVVAAAFAGFKGAEALMGGFGLGKAATQLINAATALKGAAGVETVEGGVGGLAGGSAKKLSAERKLGRGLAKTAKGIGWVATTLEVGHELLSYIEDKAEESGNPTDNGKPFVKYKGPPMGGNPHARTLTPESPFGGLPDKSLFKTQPVDVTVKPVEPLKVVVEVHPGSDLIAIKDGLLKLAAKLQARADTGPGGLGETHTEQ